MAGAAIVMGAAVASVASIDGRGWVPVGDDAAVVARARDVLSTSPPVLGMPTSLIYETGEWTYHPGPLLYAWLSPFVVLFGRVTGGAIGAATLNLVAIGGSWWFARSMLGRVGGAATGTLALLVATGFAPIYLPLNSALAACSTFAVLITAWAVLLTVPRATYALVFLASIAAQAHVAYAVVVLGVAGPVVAWDLVRRWRGVTPEGPHRAARAVAPILGFGAVLWLGPVADGGRNFVRLLGTGSGPYPHRGAGEGLATVIAALGRVPIGISGTIGIPFTPKAHGVGPLFAGDVGPAAVLVGLAGLAVVVWAWPRSATVRTGGVVLALGAVAVFIGSARMPDRDPIDVRLYWARCLSLFAFLLYGVAISTLLGSRMTAPVFTRSRLARVASCAVGILVVIGIASRSVDETWLRGTGERELAQDAMFAVEDSEVVTGDGDLAFVALGGVRTPAAVAAEQAMFAMVAARLEQGNPTFVDAYWYWGAQRSLAKRPSVLPTVVVAPRPVPGEAPPGWREVAHLEPPADLDRSVSQRVAGAVRASGEPIVLSEGAESIAPTVIDGHLPGRCEDPAAWLEDPSRFVDEAPEALVELYRAGLVASPGLPSDVNDDIWREPLYGLWVYLVEDAVPQEMARSHRLVLNRAGCAP
ncbi:MAG: hypothetical protein KDA98_10020 [Acidimicrobiales bacterium]|nr:hypothetical protein [Acidimicrobiales bacterium]